jgi:uncharacterized membrane protein YbhN (UPF0104 family)
MGLAQPYGQIGQAADARALGVANFLAQVIGEVEHRREVSRMGGPSGTAAGPDGRMPGSPPRRRQLLVLALFLAGGGAFLYFVLPQIAGIDETWERIQDGNPWWLGLAAAFEIASFGGYVILFRTVFASGAPVRWRESYEITMAGLAATRLFATAGAGGIGLTAWALRRSGMDRQTVAARMTAFLVLLYGIYMLSLLGCGLGLALGLLGGRSPFGMTVIPALFGLLVFSVALAMSLLPGDFERRLASLVGRSRLLPRWAGRAAVAPVTVAAGVRGALALVRERRPGVLGAVAWWAFDIAVLWACFRAFGDSPPGGVVVMAYFVGMLANTLPIPGGVGAVDGGMIGAFVAFGVPGGIAIVAVLSYRAFAFWLPTIPGAVAYLQLRRTVSDWEAAG